MVHLFPPRHCAGAEMMLVSMLRPLVERGHDVHVLLSRPTPDSGPYQFQGITVHPNAGSDAAWEHIEAADLVVTHLENTARAVILSRRLRRPFVVLMHNTHEASRAWAVRDAAAVVLNSEWMAGEFGHPDNGLIVRPPVFAGDYRTKPGTKVTLVNLNERKGGRLFAELAARMPDIEFLAVEGAYGEQLVPDLPNVEHRPHGGDMRSVYASTRLLLIPSDYESWGRVGVEAMCSGIPVIAHPTEGLSESLGAAGTFADRNDPAAWETAIRGLLKPRAWGAASKRAKTRAAELDPAEDIETWVRFVESVRPVRRIA